MKTEAEKVIERLEIYRLEKKISQDSLAKKLGVAFSTVNRWFNRKSLPSQIQMYHIRKILERNIKSL